MGNIEKPRPVPATQGGKGKIAAAVRETAKDAVEKVVFEKRPYLRMAFANPYNLSLLAGGIVASILTLNPVPALIALGGEALWLLHAPGSKTLRKLLWDPRFETIRLAIEEQERNERIRNLPHEEQERVRGLVAKQQEIDRLASQNPSFTGELLRTELVKTRKLVDSFIEVSLTVNRYERYLDNVSVDQLERDRERWHARAASPKVGEAEREIAKKNFAVIMKRIEKLREIRNYLAVAHGQLSLIENSFQLIADQIVTMQSPAELSGQLDDLLDGVESIRQTQADTEKMLGAMETV
ncbi:MAG TPA: hypothetical protein VNL91_10540 [Thermoanaerobaculia bacterium]|nr:hypothetical protein [Thermoanaerobaculia bacterium]